MPRGDSRGIFFGFASKAKTKRISTLVRQNQNWERLRPAKSSTDEAMQPEQLQPHFFEVNPWLVAIAPSSDFA
jgi:hypothetical protein